jgi:hypothetical protein
MKPVSDQWPKGDVSNPEVFGFKGKSSVGGVEDTALVDGGFVFERDVSLMVREAKASRTCSWCEEACG